MAIRLGGTEDDTQQPVRSGTLTASGVMASPFIELGDRWNLSVWGTFVATLRLLRSFDGGVTFIPCTTLGAEVLFSAPFSEVIEEIEAGVIYALEVTSYTSGTVNWRASR